MRSFCSPLSISAPFCGYLKLLNKEWKKVEERYMIQESNLGILHKDRELTDGAILTPN